MGAVLQFTGRLEAFGPCSECGVYAAMPEHMLGKRREDKGTFYCPNGHAQHYGTSVVDRLKKELEDKEKAIAWERSQREAAQRQVTAAKGQVTKLKKRVGNGVCPCCKRTFQQLARHMVTKHPDFKHDD